MKRSLQTYLAALRRSFTYDPTRNVYLWFGFLWGIPVPIMSIALDLELSGVPGRTPMNAILEHPIHFVFLAHPFLFALIFGAMGSVRHALEEHNAELIRTLTDLATTDELTGLHNRRYVIEELIKALQRSKRTQQKLAVVLFDLDGFKLVNDTAGHTAGDAVLRKVSNALKTVVREGDVLGRYGGDEFLLVTYGDLPSAQALAARAEEAVLRETNLGLSAGFARHPEEGATSEALIAEADRALAAVKNERYARKGSFRRGAQKTT